jgi:hypothetical protein
MVVLPQACYLQRALRFVKQVRQRLSSGIRASLAETSRAEKNLRSDLVTVGDFSLGWKCSERLQLVRSRFDFTQGAGFMIRYVCDVCKREIDPEEGLRYVVKMEIYAAFDPDATDEDENDRDHLQEIQDILEQLEDAQSEQIGDDVYRQLRFDLCPECRRRFIKNPLGRETSGKILNFSEN